MDLSETTLTNDVVFKGKIITVEKQTVQLPDMTTGEREIVHHSGGACVVAVDDGNYVYLIRQYRKALECETLELPAGKTEPGEDPYDCAVRELKEETGFEADRVEPLGSIYPTPGYCDEEILIYLATGLKSGRQELDPGEFLSVVRLPLEDVHEAVMEGRIRDAKTAVGILKAVALLDVELNG